MGLFLFDFARGKNDRNNDCRREDDVTLECELRLLDQSTNQSINQSISFDRRWL